MEFSLTILIIAITAAISISAFSRPQITNDLIFYPAAMNGGKQLHRFITHGLIHADFMHLFFNMFTLYFFGRLIESVFTVWTGSGLVFLLFYFSAILVSSLPDYFKYKDQFHYRSLGASGGVSAVLFSFILLAPWQTLYIWFIPMPSIAFAVLYVGYSVYMNKRGGDNINHGAHLWGALYGVVFTIIVKPQILSSFFKQLTNPPF